jgi:hypothetical protein
MAEMNMAFEFTCSCGQNLEGQATLSVNRAGDLEVGVTTEPCARCTGRAEESGYQSGYTEGYKDGEA